MDDTTRIGGNGHRFALRDYYENVEVAEQYLWHFDEADLKVEQSRCQCKLLQAQRNLVPIATVLRLLAGVVGVGCYIVFSLGLLGALAFPALIIWIAVMVFWPLRDYLRHVEFEGAVIKHYRDRLQLIRLIERDRQ